MDKKKKISELRDRLSVLAQENFNGGDISDFTNSLVSEELASLRATIRNNPTIKILQKISVDMAKFKKDLDLTGIISLLEEIENGIGSENETILNQVEKKMSIVRDIVSKTRVGIDKSLASNKADTDEKFRELALNLTKAFSNVRDEFTAKLKGQGDIARELNTIRGNLRDILKKSDVQDKIKVTEDSAYQKNRDEINTKIEDLRRDLITRLSKVGGGSINQKISIGGTVMSTKYADFNLKAGSNVTLTKADNNATQRVDITIASGGGGGGGIVRSIVSISGNTSADATSGTDYVYLCTGTLTLTLPDATTNTNLYTVKNVGTGTVTINTTSAQTIDGSATIVMPVRYTSVDLVSDTANWNVT